MYIPKYKLMRPSDVTCRCMLSGLLSIGYQLVCFLGRTLSPTPSFIHEPHTLIEKVI